MALLDAIYKGLLPKHATQILQLLTKLGTICHRNKETMTQLHSRLKHMFKRIKDLGYETINQLFVAYTQLAVFEGHYKSHNAVKQERIEVNHHQRDLKRFANLRKFINAMHQVFLNNKLLKPGSNKMKPLNGPITGTACCVTEGGEITEPTDSRFTTKPPTNGWLFAYASTGDQLCLEEITVFNAANYLKYTNSPLCKYPKSHPKNHYTQNCPLIKEFGLHVKYVGANDKHCKEVHKKEARKQRLTKHGGGSGNNDKDDGKENSEPNKTVTIDESKNTTNNPTNSKRNDDDDRKNGGRGRSIAAGRVSRVRGQGTELGLGTFGPLATEYPSSDDESDNSLKPVEATEANNDINELSNIYFSAVADDVLRQFDYTNSNKVTHRCLSIANRCSQPDPTSVIDFNDFSEDTDEYDKIVPDSGATAHMLKYLLYFVGGDYRRCKNSFVILGDSKQVPVLGYGTARIKIDGRVIILQNALHIPELESNLLSATRHGSNSSGCAFLISNGVMHLTFPKFTITQDVPSNGDLRLPLKLLPKNN